MIPAVELIASHSSPTEMVFTMRNRYSLTPGSKMFFLYYNSTRILFFLVKGLVAGSS